jgi:hypothetical protein
MVDSLDPDSSADNSVQTSDFISNNSRIQELEEQNTIFRLQIQELEDENATFGLLSRFLEKQQQTAAGSLASSVPTTFLEPGVELLENRSDVTNRWDSQDDERERETSSNERMLLKRIYLLENEVEELTKLLEEAAINNSSNFFSAAAGR